MRHFDVVIVGAGHAGAQAAISLRAKGYAGSIALIGDEPYPPYQRPPLSKEYFTGATPFERTLIKPATFWREKGIELLQGLRIDRLDPASSVAFLGGEPIEYGSLVWAAGGSPRRLSCDGAELPGVHTVRGRDDVDRLTEDLRTNASQRVAIIGGGYIGLELAASLRSIGLDVVLIEAAERVLARVAGESISRFLEAEQRAQGVEVMVSAKVDYLRRVGSRVGAVALDDGTLVHADTVIVGIGIAPETTVLRDAGAEISNGVIVDEACTTTLPGIYAIGDGAAQRHPFADGMLTRIESVQNADDQATIAAASICGDPIPARQIPWFWSLQYDLRLQTVGLATGYDATLVRGSSASRSFSVVYLRAGRVIALDCVNSARDFVQGRALITEGRAVDTKLLGDASIPLRDTVSPDHPSRAPVAA